MDANQVKMFCDVVGQLIVPLSAYAGVEPGKRDPADDVLVRQPRVAGAAINDALNQVTRLTPPAPPVMSPPLAPIGSTPQASEPEPAPEGEPETAAA